jgi:inorganic pyrophosphatase
MEAKEKAEQLVNKMFNWIQGGSVIEYETAKECALIAVDEILNTLPILRPAQDAVNYLENYSAIQTQLDNLSYYWQDVKGEIENL